MPFYPPACSLRWTPNAIKLSAISSYFFVKAFFLGLFVVLFLGGLVLFVFFLAVFVGFVAGSLAVFFFAPPVENRLPLLYRTALSTASDNFLNSYLVLVY